MVTLVVLDRAKMAGFTCGAGTVVLRGGGVSVKVVYTRAQHLQSGLEGLRNGYFRQ